MSQARFCWPLVFPRYVRLEIVYLTCCANLRHVTQAGGLPAVQEFAAAIVDAVADAHRPNGHVSFVGPTD